MKSKPIDFAGLERRFIETAPRLAPEFRDVPTYLLAAEQMGSDSNKRVYTAATGALYSRLFRDFIPNWIGDGITIIYSKSGIENAAQFYDWIPAFRVLGRDNIIERVFSGMTIHEFAHAVADDFVGIMKSDLPKLYTPKMIGQDRRNLTQKFSSSPVQSDHDVMIGSLQNHHRAEWVRVVFHLLYRFWYLKDREIHPVLAFDSRSFGLSDAGVYQDTFRAECETFRDRPFREIIAEPLPPAFVQLWTADIARLKNQTLQIPATAAGPTVGLPADSNAKPMEVVTMSTLSNFFGSVADLFVKRQKTFAENFADFVLDVADGKTSDPINAERVLDAAKKTPADLQQAVERVLHRRQLRKAFEAASIVPTERAKNDAIIADADAKFQRALEEHQSRTWEAANEERRLLAIERDASDAKSKLEQSADESKLVALREAEQAVGPIRQQLIDLQRRLPEMKDTLRYVKPSVSAAAEHYSDGAKGSTLTSDSRATDAPWLRDNAAGMRLSAFNAQVAKVRDAERFIDEAEVEIPRLQQELAAAEALVEQRRAELLIP